MEQRIFLSVKANNSTHTSELPEDCSVIEFIESFSNLAESVGFSPQLVIDGLKQAMNLESDRSAYAVPLP